MDDIVLAKAEIFQGLADGAVHIEPFEKANVREYGYDVTLSAQYRRPSGRHYLNPWAEEKAHDFWGSPEFAETVVSDDIFGGRAAAVSLVAGDRYITIPPHETILIEARETVMVRDPYNKTIEPSVKNGILIHPINSDASGAGGDGETEVPQEFQVVNITNSTIILPVGVCVATVVIHGPREARGVSGARGVREARGVSGVRASQGVKTPDNPPQHQGSKSSATAQKTPTPFAKRGSEIETLCELIISIVTSDISDKIVYL